MIELANEDVKLMIELKEYSSLEKKIEKMDINLLPAFFQKALIECKAGLLKLSEAEILYEKFNLNDVYLKARIYFLSGKHKEALKYAEEIKDVFLITDILLANGQHKEALENILKTTVNEQWYYYAGRCYGQLFETDKAITCLEKARELLAKKVDQVQEVIVLAQLANFFYQQGNLKKATSIFEKIKKLFSDKKIKIAPQFLASCFISYAYFNLNQGRLFIALRAACRAQKLSLKAFGSITYLRSQILFACCLRRLGYLKKAIHILSSLNPSKKYMIMDKLRYQALAYAEIGQGKLAINCINEAKKYISEEDHYGIFYLPIDETIVLFSDGQSEFAEKKARAIIDLAEQRKNLEAMNYCKSLVASWIFDQKLAEESYQYHKKNGFLIDAARDQLSLIYIKIKNSSYEEALKILEGMDRLSLPIQEIQRWIFIGLCHYHLKSYILAEQAIFKAQTFIGKREHFVWQAFCYYLLLNFENLGRQFINYFESYRYTIAQLSIGQIEFLNKMIMELKIPQEKRYVSLNFQEQKHLNKLEMYQLLRVYPKTAIDLVSKKIYFNGIEESKIQNFPLLKKVLFFLTHDLSKTYSKEEIILSVFEKREYDPRTDDNLLYVAINRLKKILPEKDIILSSSGCYSLNPEKQFIVLAAASNDF